MSDEDPPEEPDDDHVKRADAELVEELRRCGCRGRRWDETVERLVGYADAVVTGMLHTGRLPAKSAELGRPIRLSDDAWRALTTFEAVEWRSAANEAMTVALDLFRSRAILGGEWDERRAGLQTYFVNGVVRALGNPLRRWETGFRRHRWSGWSDAPTPDHDLAGPDPLDAVLGSHDLTALLTPLDPVLREALFLLAFTDLTRSAIAGELGISRAALDRKLRHFRDRHQYGDNDD